MFALSTERAGMVGRDLDLTLGEFADATREHIESLRDEVGRGGCGGTDPIDRLRTKDCWRGHHVGARRQTTHHSAAAHLPRLEAHSHSPCFLGGAPRFPAVMTVVTRALGLARFFNATPVSRYIAAQPTGRNKGRVQCTLTVVQTPALTCSPPSTGNSIPLM